MKKPMRPSAEALFVKTILPVIKESYPLSEILNVTVIRDVFRVALYRIRMRPESEIIQSYIVLKGGVMLFSEN